MNKHKQMKKTHKHRQQYGGYLRRRKVGDVEEYKGGQIYGDGRRLDLEW